MAHPIMIYAAPIQYPSKLNHNGGLSIKQHRHTVPGFPYHSDLSGYDGGNLYHKLYHIDPGLVL